MITQSELFSTTDATIWARAFLEQFPDPGCDEGTLISWFANAIEIGRNAARENVRVLFDGSATEPQDLYDVVFQALGAASICWENPSGAGVFDSSRAKAIGDELLAWIEERYQPRGGMER